MSMWTMTLVGRILAFVLLFGAGVFAFVVVMRWLVAERHRARAVALARYHDLYQAGAINENEYLERKRRLLS